MALEDPLVKQLIIDLLKTPSERDGQSLIGASEIGNPCPYCLASRLVGEGGGGPSQYWLGARIGTAIHAALEEEEAKHIEVPKSYHFEGLEGAMIEEKIVLGKIEGYGTIKSKPDLVLTKYNHLIDHKTTTKLKLKKYKLDGVPEQYVVQQSLYAWGLEKMGVKIDRISLSFVCRDGAQDSDIWIKSWDYDAKVAEKAWDRLQKAYNWTLDPTHDIEDLESHPDCFRCSAILHRM